MDSQTGSRKVEDEAVLFPDCFQVGPNNCEVNILHRLNRLQLHYDLVLDHEVETVPCHLFPIVQDRDANLTRMRETALAQLDAQRALVDRF